MLLGRDRALAPPHQASAAQPLRDDADDGPGPSKVRKVEEGVAAPAAPAEEEMDEADITMPKKPKNAIKKPKIDSRQTVD